MALFDNGSLPDQIFCLEFRKQRFHLLLISSMKPHTLRQSIETWHVSRGSIKDVKGILSWVNTSIPRCNGSNLKNRKINRLFHHQRVVGDLTSTIPLFRRNVLKMRVPIP